MILWVLFWSVFVVGLLYLLILLWRGFCRIDGWMSQGDQDQQSLYYYIGPDGLEGWNDREFRRLEKAGQTADIYLVVLPDWQNLRLVGAEGLQVAREKRPIWDTAEWSLAVSDHHGRRLIFPFTTEGEEETAIEQVLQAAAVYRKRGCHCLAEAQLYELESYAATAMLNGCLTISIPQGASPYTRLALKRLSEHLCIELGA